MSILYISSFAMSIKTKESFLPFVSSAAQVNTNYYPKDFIQFARLPYCKSKIINKLSCSFCNSNEFIGFQTYTTHQIKDPLFVNRVFKFTVLYNDDKGEVIVSFAGPSTEEGDFFNNILNEGFVQPSDLGGAVIEKVYWDIYSTFMRSELFTKIRTLQASQRQNYTYVFVGHSFGGSLAVLSAYDLTYRGVLQRMPYVFTYGMIRIGNNSFVNKVNERVQIFNTVNQNDYLSKVPNCMFIKGEYRCYDTSEIVQSYPNLSQYLNNYFSKTPYLVQTSPLKQNVVYNLNQNINNPLPLSLDQTNQQIMYQNNSYLRNSIIAGSQANEKIFDSSFNQPLAYNSVTPLNFSIPNRTDESKVFDFLTQNVSNLNNQIKQENDKNLLINQINSEHKNPKEIEYEHNKQTTAMENTIKAEPKEAANINLGKNINPNEVSQNTTNPVSTEIGSNNLVSKDNTANLGNSSITLPITPITAATSQNKKFRFKEASSINEKSIRKFNKTQVSMGFKKNMKVLTRENSLHSPQPFGKLFNINDKGEVQNCVFINGVSSCNNSFESVLAKDQHKRYFDINLESC